MGKCFIETTESYLKAQKIIYKNRIARYKIGGDKMIKISKEERELRAKVIARAVRDSKNLKGYVKIWFHDKSKEYIVTYLIHAIQGLKEIHDQYNPLGKELFKDE